MTTKRHDRPHPRRRRRTPASAIAGRNRRASSFPTASGCSSCPTWCLFSALFATYASLAHATDGGPTSNQLFDRTLVAIETMALLLSSFTCGLAMIAAKRGNMVWTQGWLLVTGPARLRLPVDRALSSSPHDRAKGRAAAQRLPVVLLHAGRLPRRACHLRSAVDRHDDGADLGQGVPGHIMRRLLCLSVFWHALDIIWVAIFTIVYLIGTLP
jgi:hypothetical protein